MTRIEFKYKLSKYNSAGFCICIHIDKIRIIKINFELFTSLRTIIYDCRRDDSDNITKPTSSSYKTILDIESKGVLLYKMIKPNFEEFFALLDKSILLDDAVTFKLTENLIDDKT